MANAKSHKNTQAIHKSVVGGLLKKYRLISKAEQKIAASRRLVMTWREKRLGLQSPCILVDRL